MTIKIVNKINLIPAVVNIFWSILILYQFFFRVPSFDNQHPDGASYFIVGIIIVSFLIFLGSLIFIRLVNLFKKVKFYSDMYFAFIPIIILLSIILLRL